MSSHHGTSIKVVALSISFVTNGTGIVTVTAGKLLLLPENINMHEVHSKLLCLLYTTSKATYCK